MEREMIFIAWAPLKPRTFFLSHYFCRRYHSESQSCTESLLANCWHGTLCHLKIVQILMDYIYDASPIPVMLALSKRPFPSTKVWLAFQNVTLSRILFFFCLWGSSR